MRANIPDVATLMDQVLNSTSPLPKKTKLAIAIPTSTSPQQSNVFLKLATALRNYNKPKLTFEILDIVKEAAINKKNLEFKSPKLYGSHPYQKLAHELRVKNAEHLNELVTEAGNILKAQMAINILKGMETF